MHGMGVICHSLHLGLHLAAGSKRLRNHRRRKRRGQQSRRYGQRDQQVEKTLWTHGPFFSRPFANRKRSAHHDCAKWANSPAIAAIYLTLVWKIAAFGLTQLNLPGGLPLRAEVNQPVRK
jgi:hypothetical protein